MVPIGSLWLPIVLSAAGVWIASSIVWMVLPHHKKDFAGFDDEDAVRRLLRDATPGQYNVPHVDDRKDMGTPEFKARADEGPIMIATVMPRGLPSMGKSLGQWFVMNLFVAGFAAYIATRALPAGADYLRVFQIVGSTVWATYGVGLAQQSIWFGTPWSKTVKQLLDSLLYAMVSAGVFGWLWPAA